MPGVEHRHTRKGGRMHVAAGGGWMEASLIEPPVCPCGALLCWKPCLVEGAAASCNVEIDALGQHAGPCTNTNVEARLRQERGQG